VAVAVPQRVQYRRGVALPADVTYVGRPTPWGNPFPVTVRGAGRPRALAEVVTRFALYLEQRPRLRETARQELTGRNLACWCSLRDPFCHADVWLQETNPVETAMARHRRAEYWMGMADVLGSMEPRLRANAQRFAARWERATFEVVSPSLPKTRGIIAVSACSLLVKAGEHAAAREWAEARLADENLPTEDRHNLTVLLKEAS